MSKTVAPSIADTAFNCPHCGAFTSQAFYALSAEEIKGDKKTPFIPKPAFKAKLSDDKKNQELIEWIDKMASGRKAQGNRGARRRHKKQWLKPKLYRPHFPGPIMDSSSINAVSISSARTTKRFPSPRCASTIQIVRPLESIAEIQPQLQPTLLRLSAMVSQYCFSNRHSACFALQTP
jgi:hypothetical protein